MNEQWKCFHCSEVFDTPESAREHFGASECSKAACKLSPDIAGLVSIIRDQERELQKYRLEDSASYREFYALGVKHSQELRAEEERGYARGLEDAKKYPEILGLVRRAGAPESRGSNE
jgi:hypothetical protein